MPATTKTMNTAPAAKTFRRRLGSKGILVNGTSQQLAWAIHRNSSRHGNRRLPEIFQRQLQSAEVRVIIHAHLEANIEGVARFERTGLQALRHPPAHGFVVEARFSIRQLLVHAQFDVLLFYDL